MAWVRPDHRRPLLIDALGFVRLETHAPELRLLTPGSPLDRHRRMQRQGYEVSMGDHGGQWIVVFYEGHGGYETLRAAGTAQAPVQQAAWEALNKPAEVVRQPVASHRQASAEGVNGVSSIWARAP